MRTKDKGNSNFRSKPKSFNHFYFSGLGNSHKTMGDQQFVVPWQMVEEKEKEYLVE